MTYLFLIIFWTGIALIPPLKKKESLKDRADRYLGRLKKRSENSALSEIVLNIKRNTLERKRLNELSESLAYIRNITILGRGRSISAELLLEELSDLSVSLKKTYLDMAHALSLNDRSKACEIFESSVGGGYGRDVGNFLVSWEDIAPDMLLSTIDAFVDSIRQERITYLKRRDEAVSDFIYMPVIFNCMTVLMNFIYIAYFIEQKEALAVLF